MFRQWMANVAVALMVVAAILASTSGVAYSSADHPLEPPDRSSPRATLTTFLDSFDRAWERYSAGDPGFEESFRDARGCLDLNEIPPLVLREVAAESALILIEVLHRLGLPPLDEVPDRAAVEELGLTRWALPHTEIYLARIADGDRRGQWVFSAGTVWRIQEFYTKVRHLPYQPGRTGSHLEELRAGSGAILLMRLVEVMPSWFRSEIGGMMVWQWFGLGLLVVMLGLAVFALVWLGRRWRGSRLPGHALASYLLPLAMIFTPLIGRQMLERLFTLPGTPALVVRLLFSIVGFAGLAWLVGLAITGVGNMTVRLWFREARPLKKQLVRVGFRIATIVVVTAVVVKAMQILGVPVSGLIAGLGVGGLAIALAAQSTLENFLGGVILYADKPVKVGDFCRFGDRLGTVEDVGLRSVKIRTLDRTVVTVPNGDFAKLHLENLTERDRVLLREKICLRYETTREQLQMLLSELESMLKDHARIADEPLRVRFTGFGEYSLEVELYAYAVTAAWPEFLEIREEVLLKVMAIVERSGTRLALPTEIHYIGGQGTVGEKPVPGQPG